ncbi:MAG TPA: NADAR family protein [Anaerolineales bacterium]|nr:NADAR family protein [Anaerolineales bacterium]
MENIIIQDIKSLINFIKDGHQPTYLFFWGHRARKDGLIGKQCLSQWWPSSFIIGRISYSSAEQYLMAEKALLFGDEEMRAKILLTSSPEEVKDLGRRINGFDEDVWSNHRVNIALQANEAKFRQTDSLKKFLLETHEKVLVEASPVDIVWGIGLKESDPRANDPHQWRRQNLLGFTLMEIRSRLREGISGT